jgi:NADPH:quinone reductase-like Zn-dependent oxidoreductase
VRACYATAYGGPEVLRIGELPDPNPGRGEVVVAVEASSLNPVDWKIRRGDVRLLSGRRFPRVLGTDVAGTVASAARGAGWREGDRVYGMTATVLGRPGAHAERVRVAGRRLRRIPEALPFEEAAALPVAGLTAVHGLRGVGPLQGRRVVVVGATGGVGHLALQIARARGAVVTAVCRGANAALARELGADDVVDHRREDLTSSGRRWDVVFDAWGGLGFARASRALEPGGAYATTLALPREWLSFLAHRARGGRARLVSAHARGRPADYAELEALVLDRRVRPVLGAVYPLERAVEAYEASEGHAVRGKIVLRVG